jgi:ribonuclease III family protein
VEKKMNVLDLSNLPKSPSEMSPLTLAYLGDAIYEVYVRQHLISQGIFHPNQLQQEATQYVSAVAQAKVVHRIKEQLTDEEMAILRRGRNAKSGSVPKNASVSDYRYSTGLEALIGFLYLTNCEQRLQELMQMILEQEKEEKEDGK